MAAEIPATAEASLKRRRQATSGQPARAGLGDKSLTALKQAAELMLVQLEHIHFEIVA
jgi:hypothetical protein